MKKITYIGPIPEGHIEHDGRVYRFKRGTEIEGPEAVAIAKEYQEPNEWRVPEDIQKAVVARRKAEKEAAEKAKAAAEPAKEKA